MMNKTDNFDYFVGNDFAALQLPYGNKQFRATIILPNEGNTIESIMDNFDFAKWNQLQNGLHNGKVIVGLPKFKLEQEFMLNKTMGTLGMKKAFTDSAELTGISKPGNIYVSFVKQNTFVALDEEGTEAAAVTTIGVGLTSVGPGSTPKFICDRPFAIIISEKTSNTILFMGKIMNPEFS
jgi:serpin B